MIAGIRRLGTGQTVLLALVVAVLIGALAVAVPALGNVGMLLASAALVAACAVLAQWLWQHQHGTDWSNSFTHPPAQRGGDPRITRLTATIEAALAGDRAAQAELQQGLRSLATERLRDHRGLSLEPHDQQAVTAALGPELTAYLAGTPTTRLTPERLRSFVTTLEELS
jgi:hypothetical protein